ncbi:triosephosphate isomerase [Aequitasia blattaphilus]|uniref:Triosephosphate isomerase n=1 Tax=Aequitasia blattaphilus TaxID=2949332 RepID=A0ABT1E8X5_9FIRM|nr:triose-phosphate isomerase [Aequitasia blattaphilus]MCP1102146.1 triose-phosphate isomerase [Aequitasia blattaphilus]MCR8614786.1 triose-phosphate isomerase [Aequitasia blattaphilus]
MKKKLYFGSNLKMYKNSKDTLNYLNELVGYTKDISREDIELFIIPSYTSLENASGNISHEAVKIGAQNMNWEEEGQFTGEISPLMLKELGVDLVMIGHSERRHVFGETDVDENKKVLTSLKHGFTTLLCVGETGEQKDFGISKETIRTQLKIGLFNVQKEDIGKLWVAYEPVWSIGVNGTPATSDYAEEIHQTIKETLVELFGEDSKKIPVLYGGSVNNENSVEMIKQPSVDGLFIGRSAWVASNFNTIIRESMKSYKEANS